ncbi:MAG: Integral rane sensor signal transduction histidine kinase [Verrucomicrobiaceae bacterium]|nr:Integral rane sensor signal transduction histidine kinase [Verrucomicrobiaceae bacterium]
MKRIRNLPIRRKLTLVIMLTCTAVLIVAFAALLVFHALSTRSQYVKDLIVLGGIIAHNSAAAVAFNDSDGGARTLEGLSGRTDIESASLTMLTGENVTQFDLTGPHDPQDQMGLLDGPRIIGNDVLIASPITWDGQRLGTLYLRADFRPTLHNLMKLYGGILAGVLFVSLLLVLFLASRSQRLFTAPILHLADVLRQVAERGDYSLRATRTTSDEVGDLTVAFNGMLSQIQQRDAALQAARNDLELRVEERTSELETVHAQLLDTSRKAGMAEVATSVLHNVGNVLNSVNVSCSVISENVRRSRITSLHKAAELMQAHADNLGPFLTLDPTGRKLPEFLGRLSRRLTDEQNANLTELRSLDQNIEHIKNIVSMQQSYASTATVREALPMATLVEEAIRLTSSNRPIRASGALRIERHYGDTPVVSVEKHKTLQILVNLLRNARDSLAESRRIFPRIDLRIASTPDHGHIRVSVTDNGIGIPEQNLPRIFAHGFTTKEGGHGFGLHSSVLAAQEMGGSLHALSEGINTGATFTLELPLRMSNSTKLTSKSA